MTPLSPIPPLTCSSIKNHKVNKISGPSNIQKNLPTPPTALQTSEYFQAFGSLERGKALSQRSQVVITPVTSPRQQQVVTWEKQSCSTLLPYRERSNGLFEDELMDEDTNGHDSSIDENSQVLDGIPHSTLTSFKGYLVIPAALLGFLYCVLKSYNDDLKTILAGVDDRQKLL
ncbi:Uncharacterized protein APZ42_013003 [Daphnia magna]|uniref:Uncharacterized protein n=1 Tax=Daphnia magna TaxID=35525 RepID=A0A162R9S9_9CRUS|nr:Uncharacterized protein APZ42_013003 [Daphnia magna]